jgi:hypothetical protein
MGIDIVCRRVGIGYEIIVELDAADGGLTLRRDDFRPSSRVLNTLPCALISLITALSHVLI